MIVRWQHMEIAPQDGTEIIICFPMQEYCMMICRWDTVHSHWLSKGESLGVTGGLWQSLPLIP